MINKLIDSTNRHIERYPIPPIPKPSPQALALGQQVNRLTAISLIGFGLVAGYKWSTALGVASLTSNYLLQKLDK